MKPKFKFTIARKLTLGFGVILIAVFTTSYFNYRTLDRNMEMNLGVINEVYTPSRTSLNELNNVIINSRVLIKNWVYVDKKPNTSDKQRLKKLLSEDIPSIKEEISPLVSKWPQEHQDIYKNIEASIDSLIDEHRTIMNKLNSFEAYNDPMVFFPVRNKLEQGGIVTELTQRVLDKLNTLISKQESLIETTNNKMMNSFLNLQKLIVFMGVFLIISVILIGIITTRALVSPINHLKQIILNMGKGILPKYPIKERNDEIGEMAKALNGLVDGLKRTSEFANKIGEGKFESEFQPLSQHDVLGNSLILMRDNLKSANEEEEKRKEEDRQRSWANQGLAKFGEILRESTDDMEEFSYRIISNLVKYLDAEIGGLYLVNDDDPENKYLELTATYAYGRQKYIRKSIDFGVTIIGQVAQEKEKMYMTEIPDDYIKISSGLGEDKPTCLLVVPLIMNDVVYGILELASFREFRDFELNFVDNVSDIIASTVSNVKTNLNTAQLLQESQEKSEKMAKQEEESKKRIEEMKKKQEELKQQTEEEKKRSEQIKQDFNNKLRVLENQLHEKQEQLTEESIYLQGTLEAINNTIGAAELNMQGIFLKANNQYLKMTGTRMEHLNGKRQSNFMLKEKVNQPEYQKLWADINKGIARITTIQYFFKNEEKWFRESYTPIKDKENNYYKIIVLAYDVTDQIKQQQQNTEG